MSESIDELKPQISPAPPGERALVGRTSTYGCLINVGVFIAAASIPAIATYWYGGIVILPAVFVMITILSIVMRDDQLSQKFLLRTAKRVFKMRPELFVDPDDPEALFVQVIPRANWSKTMAERASDIGFLLADPQRRVLIFEGDNERWVIPARSVVSIAIESYQETKRSPSVNIVVLALNTVKGPVEYPIAPRMRGKKYFRSSKRDTRVLELFNLVTRALETSVLEKHEPIEIAPAHEVRVPTAIATLTLVETPGELLTKTMIYTGNLIEFPLIIIFFAATPLAWWLGFTTPAGITCIVVWVLVIAYTQIFGSVLANALYAPHVRRVLANRAGAVVRPDNNDAVIIDVVPREHWGKIMLENAADSGLFLADPVSHRLLFEGDRERWIIEPTAVVSCILELKKADTPFTAILLTVNTPQGPREIPFVSRCRDGRVLPQPQRDDRTRALYEMIQAAIDLPDK